MSGRRPALVAVLAVALTGTFAVALAAALGGRANLPPPAGTATASPITDPSRAPAATASASIAPQPTDPLGQPTIDEMVGQKLMVAMSGTRPTADLLGRISRGEVGGVILFGANITSREDLMALTAELQSAAAGGGRPPLLIAVDQEGGKIRRLPWAPPMKSAVEIGVEDLAEVARSEGADTGTELAALGINVNLAPVADVPRSPRSFMYRDERTFSFDPSRTAILANAFAQGLESAGVVPTMKHFPGIGRAALNTDTNVVVITASADELDAELDPYREAIGRRIPMIMLSNATYAAYDEENGAGWSRAISVDLLRDRLGFSGVTITDGLEGTAKARRVAVWRLAVRAARAGTDMLLLTGPETSTSSVYAQLLAQARSGSVARADLRSSYERILALKAGL